MKLSMMTLGCPAWSLETIVARAAEYGFDGIDFRGVGDDLDITTTPAFTTDVAATRKRIDDAGLAVSNISTSIQLAVPEKLEANLEEAKRSIAVAAALGAPSFRVFGQGGDHPGGRIAAADQARRCMEAILELDGARQFKWLCETHDAWIRSADLMLILERVPDRAFGVMWDAGHTSRVGGELPAETCKAIGDRLGGVHIKDAVHEPDHEHAMKDGWRYVLPGQGQLPIAGATLLLDKKGYDGWLTFEHEKRWHPELPEPEEAFPAFVHWYKQAMAKRPRR